MKFKYTNYVLGGLIFLGLLFYIYLYVLAPKRVNEAYKLSKLDTAFSTSTAILAGGCFWCVESDFEKLEGVLDVVSGYSGGVGDNPTYENYSGLGYVEVVKVIYDSTKVSYGQLVEYLIKHSDPTDAGGSFYDRGIEYAPVVYYSTEEEKQIAEDVIKIIDDKKIYDKKIAIAVLPYSNFYRAEEYHQDYYKKNYLKYSYYRNASGRDDFIKKHWGDNVLPEIGKIESTKNGENFWENFKKPTKEELKSILTPLQYKVTQEEGTEQPFNNEYNKNEEEGIYVDIVSLEPLFSSTDKYDSGTGWPSFTKPLEGGNIVLKEDKTLFYVRTEVRSKYGDSHLGHVFDDGPKDKGGLRYCMNSASLLFVPKDKLIEKGYGKYLGLFNN